MVIDAVLMKAKVSNERDAPTIIGTMLGKDATNLISMIQAQFVDALDRQAVDLNPDLQKWISFLLVLACRIWSHDVGGANEGPKPSWLRRYLGREVIAGTYKAWDKKDLVWAVYSYFL